jgi:hypothetical protein
VKAVLAGGLGDFNGFGRQVSRLGDLNRDGHPEFLVSQHEDDDALSFPAVCILFTNNDCALSRFRG